MRRDLGRWLARELHDVVAQRLTTVLIELAQLRHGRLPEECQPRLDFLADEVRESLAEVRDLLGRLRGEPRVAASFVREINDTVAAFHRRSGIPVELRVGDAWPVELPADTACNLRRIVEEALANVAKHSGASVVEVSMEVIAGRLCVEIVDDGRGVTDRVWDESSAGMLGMRERAMLLGGRLEIADAPSGGTLVQVAFGWPALLKSLP